MQFKKMLVPVDFSDCSQRALEAALSLAAAQGAKVTALHVYEPPYLTGANMLDSHALALTSIQEQMELAAQSQFEAMLQRTQEKGALETPAWPQADSRIVMGDPLEVILKIQEEEHWDLLVMGTNGRRGFAHVVLGSVAERVVRHAKRPVLVVR